MVESMFTSTFCTAGFLIALALHSLTHSISTVSPSAWTLGLLDETTRLQQTVPGSWDSSQFDPSRWDHYALIVVFLGISSWGLWLSWQWKQEKHQARSMQKQPVGREQAVLVKGGHKE